MTKQEAILMMENGNKVKHYLFESEEYIYMKNGKIHDENDYLLEVRDANNRLIDFWSDRTGEVWEDGWILLPN